jgi:hypothetical protein
VHLQFHKIALVFGINLNFEEQNYILLNTAFLKYNIFIKIHCAIYKKLRNSKQIFHIDFFRRSEKAFGLKAISIEEGLKNS